jgi:hypothetical protein
MLKSLARRQLQAFAREWNYDTAYMQEILEAGGLDALIPFMKFQKMAQYRRDIPIAPHFVAGLVAIRAGDCGPCVQLTVTMAERAGVDPALLRAVLERRPQGLTDDARLVYEFTEATIAHDPAADPLRERIVARWGKRALISLAYAIASGAVYPAVKYALGYGHACSRVRIAGAEMPVPALQPA